MFENGNRPQAVTMVPGILELNVETKDRENRPASAIDRLSLRHVA
jgi:hypothetical protein